MDTHKPRTQDYRCSFVTTRDYGDGPGAGVTTIATLAAIPNGTHWQSRPTTIDIAVPAGTRPGSIWSLTLVEKDRGQ